MSFPRQQPAGLRVHHPFEQVKCIVKDPLGHPLGKDIVDQKELPFAAHHQAAHQGPFIQRRQIRIVQESGGKAAQGIPPASHLGLCIAPIWTKSVSQQQTIVKLYLAIVPLC